jgi:alkylhydroperoxidase family enzyme
MPARWRVIADFAIKLTEAPARLIDDDAAALRGVGLGDEGFHDVVAITAYFNFVNRMAEGVHLPLEGDGG